MSQKYRLSGLWIDETEMANNFQKSLDKIRNELESNSGAYLEELSEEELMKVIMSEAPLPRYICSKKITNLCHTFGPKIFRGIVS